MLDAYDFWGARLNPLCGRAISRALRPAGQCFDEVMVYSYLVRKAPAGLGLPLLVQHSFIDGYQAQEHGVESPESREIFRTPILERFSQARWIRLFSGGERPHRCATIRNSNWTMGPEGLTFQEVLTRFWGSSRPEVVLFGNPWRDVFSNSLGQSSW
jgi:hypothetical protein